MNGLFLALPAVSGSPSSEESCTSIYAYLELLWIPSLSTKKFLLVGFFPVSFIRQEKYSDACLY